MGGFTSAPPVIAGKFTGAATFLHESNSIPGRANRLVAPFVNQVFVGFPSARLRLQNRNVVSTGTPVRPQFQPASPESCRIALGLAPNRPVLLVVGGSQGASGINSLMMESVLALREAEPNLQVLHLTGPNDLEKVRAAYDVARMTAVVQPFLTEMDMALGAATLCVSRAGASSLAELAAMRLPAILIPFPSAADNHQYYNARAYADANAAWLVDQTEAAKGKLARMIVQLLRDEPRRTAMADELARWHAPHAAEKIADQMLAVIKVKGLQSEAVSQSTQTTQEHQLNSAVA
jgi:UDP-N-acetylglucosamine--N-acetylmuramyl-(pentapeptide) pyrophosphoryl-undecaprenol N-acetylglucosamine transferase